APAVVGPAVIGVAAGLVGMPDVVDEIVSQPAFGPAPVYKPEGQIVGAADVAQVIEVLVGAADGQQVGAAGGQAGSVVRLVDRVERVVHAGGRFRGVVPVRYAVTQHLLQRRIVERIKVRIVVTHLIDVNHRVRRLLESLQQAVDEGRRID